MTPSPLPIRQRATIVISVVALMVGVDDPRRITGTIPMDRSGS